MIVLKAYLEKNGVQIINLDFAEPATVNDFFNAGLINKNTGKSDKWSNVDCFYLDCHSGEREIWFGEWNDGMISE